MSVKVLDIETNDLLANMLDFSCLPYKLKPTARLWCIVVYDLSSKTYTRLSSEGGNEICREDVARALDGCTELVTYNGVKFDLLTLKLFGLLDYTIGYLDEPDTLYGKEVKITDDLVRSRLFNPDRRGGHSLKSWGERLGEYKDDFRAKCVESGHILRDSVKGSEFRNYTPLMVDYCQQDTLVTAMVHSELEKEYIGYKGWKKAEKLENKLADIAIRRESYGFYFDKDLAIECLGDLQNKMDDLQNRVNPILPLKMMNKTNIKQFTPPKNQLKQDNTPTAHMLNFAKKHGATITDTLFEYKGKCYSIPFTDPIERYEKADISDLDHVKKHLIDLGWNPTEFKIRDLTKDSKKQSIIYEKRVKALDTWLDQTFDEGKYKKHRLLELGMGTNKVSVRQKLIKKLSGDRPVRVPTSPCVRVGVEKDLCPNLTSLGEKVSFANDFTLYLTYKHRKSSIAGGDLEDVDFDDEYPNTGFLSMYREVDKRIPTPAIEIGASTNRYRHIGVCNVARASSIYGEQMRSLFGCGEGMRQLGFDFSSLEARIQGHYILLFNGEELAQQLLASKPNDIHSVNAKKLGIPRDQAKSVSYMLMYGGSAKRAQTMLGCTLEEAEIIVEAYWDAVLPLKMLREAMVKKWEERDKKYIIGVDGRKIFTRSQHSLLNSAFQSGGVICAKYATVFIYQLLEAQGFKCDPFAHSGLDMCGMIEYHDECQLAVHPKHIPLKVFNTEDEALEFKKSWVGEQLGELTHLKNGKPCLALPNPVSKAISEAISLAEKEVNLKVPLGMEWIVHKNWFGCH